MSDRWRRPTLRTRITAVAGLAIALAVTGGMIVIYLAQIHAVNRTVDLQLRTYITQLIQASPDGRWPQPLPASPLDNAAEAQVIGADGQVLAATRGLTGVGATYELAPGAKRPHRLPAADGVLPDEVHVVAVRRFVAGQPVTVVAASPVGLIAEMNGEFVWRLAVGFPLILAAAVASVWLLVGRALRPVARIRAAAAEITASDLHRRVPVPGTRDEVGELADTMNDMLDRLDRSHQRQRRFVADASHELRTPLAAIRTSLEVGLAHPDRAPWPSLATGAVANSQRLELLIDQLLTLAKADEGQLAARRTPVDLHGLTRDVVRAADPARVPTGIDIAPDTVVPGDRAQLRLMLRNLHENAVRHAATGVAVTAETGDGRVTLHVDDDGPGIPPEDRERVFERFVRLDASRERGTGTAGLGLSIAREIARVHRATVTVDRAPTGGARVSVEFPTG